MWKNFFESIAYLFEEVFLVPFNFLREMQLDAYEESLNIEKLPRELSHICPQICTQICSQICP